MEINKKPACARRAPPVAARGARPNWARCCGGTKKRLFWASSSFCRPCALLWQFSYGAFLQTVWNSVHLTNIQGQAVSFCGLELYRTLLTSGEFWNSCFVSVKFVLMTVFPSLAIALLLAALCRKRLPGGKLVEILFFHAGGRLVHLCHHGVHDHAGAQHGPY